MSKQSEKAEADTLAAVQGILPEGWEASKCMALDPGTGSTSDTMVMVWRDGCQDFQKEGLANGQDVKRLRVQWRAKCIEELGPIKAGLVAAGFKVRQDGPSLYVKVTRVKP